MARMPRLDLPGTPQHIVQRGNNRLPCFLDDADRLRYLQAMQEALLATEVQLHAYVLMDNHVHLLATPAAAGDIGRLMQRLGRQYVGLFNARHRRTGTLWEGRYKSCLVDSERDVLICQRYIELNPVRARITDDSVAWRWSSCAAHLGERKGSMLTPHPAWLALDSDPLMRARMSGSESKKTSPRSANTSNNSAPWAAMISAPWSKPKRDASLAYVLRIDQGRRISEPDPVTAPPRYGVILDKCT